MHTPHHTAPAKRASMLDRVDTNLHAGGGSKNLTRALTLTLIIKGEVEALMNQISVYRGLYTGREPCRGAEASTDNPNPDTPTGTHTLGSRAITP